MFCPWEPPVYLIFSSNVPQLLFYSHIPTMIISLILGLLLYFKNRKNILSRVLLAMIVLFFAWCFFDLILWGTNDPSTVIFFWTSQIIVEPIIYMLGAYLMVIYVKRSDVSFSTKVISIVIYLPIVLLSFTPFSLIGIELADCNAVEGFIAQYYTYIIEFIFAISSLIFSMFYLRKIKDDLKYKESSRYLIVGLILFFTAFSWGNIIGSFTDNWQLAQAGLFGMPIFVGYLVYIMVRFRAFNIKLLGTQALVVGLIVLIGSQFFFIKDTTNLILNSATFLAVLIFGNFLVKSVKREVEQRERLQALTNELATANTKLQSVDKLKTEFLSLASHQLRSPLTAIKGYSSMLLEGSFGAMTLQQKEAIDRVFQSVSHLTKVVNDLLNVSKIEQGGMVYTKTNYDFGISVKNVTDELRISAKNKNLALDYEDDARGPYMINGDEEKIRQVVINLIDNSIKYTPEGSINVRISKQGSKVLLAIKDTGMGMTEEIRQTLFKKFARGEGGKVNTSGSGLGLYLAKEISEAHNGRVWVESPGPGKGSTFFVEFELVKGV
jgi:signal transduction histidine kinase